jgi:nitroimidazol reductase NimA-like FMN-containing flavoprotein (pyridoxamine 5'-phosphate oxidase superfamily)
MDMNYDNSNVRLQNRLLPQERAEELLEKGGYGFMAMQDIDGGGYGLPLSFVREDNHIYFHCAREGKKLQVLAKNPKVTFTVVGKTEVSQRMFTAGYESVMVHGTVTVNLDEEETLHALLLMVDKFTPDNKPIGKVYAEKSLFRVKVMRLDMESVSGKCRVLK